MTIAEHYKRAIEAVSSIRKEYTEYGCSPELTPIPEALYEAEQKLANQLKSIQQ